MIGAVKIDTAYGNVGDNTGINISVNEINSDEINISVRFTIENPTVFYPETAIISNSNNSVDISILKHDRFNYSFEISDFKMYESREFSIVIDGILLAGNDSICRVNFHDCILNDSIFIIPNGVVKSDNGFIPLPYIRYSKIYQNYPNPVFSGNKTIFKYNVDKETYVELIMSDNNGKVINRWDFDSVEKGEHEFEFIPGLELSAGSYTMSLNTITGQTNIKFIVIK